MVVAVVFSFLVNIAVVAPITAMIARADPAMAAVYGPDSPARRILACLYGAIGAVSAYALAAFALTGDRTALVSVAVVLFPLQIVYKLATLPAVGWASPVVKANLVIVFVHAVSLAAVSRAV